MTPRISSTSGSRVLLLLEDSIRIYLLVVFVCFWTGGREGWVDTVESLSLCSAFSCFPMVPLFGTLSCGVMVAQGSHDRLPFDDHCITFSFHATNENKSFRIES
jgi:hypothetical protein